jgi:hypothetical protein
VSAWSVRLNALRHQSHHRRIIIEQRHVEEAIGVEPVPQRAGRCNQFRFDDCGRSGMAQMLCLSPGPLFERKGEPIQFAANEGRRITELRPLMQLRMGVQPLRRMSEVDGAEPLGVSTRLPGNPVRTFGAEPRELRLERRFDSARISVAFESQ